MILIVDDHVDTGTVLCKLLGMNGYSCNWITSPRAALEAIQAHTPGEPLLVLLDHNMPDMSGIQVLEKLRAAPQTMNVSVVMYSASFDPVAENKSKSLGALGWVCKGSGDMSQFFKTIDDAYKHACGESGKPTA